MEIWTVRLASEEVCREVEELISEAQKKGRAGLRDRGKVCIIEIDL